MRINLKQTEKLYREKVYRMDQYNRTRNNTKNPFTIEAERKESDKAREALLQDKGYKAITDAIMAAEKRCKARCIATWDVMDDLIKINDRLKITKKALEGTTVMIDHNATTFTKSYMGMSYTQPQATIVCAEYHNGGWILTDIRRDDSGKEKYHLRLSETAKQAILENAALLKI